MNTDYFWQVVPYNTYGDAEDCPVWTFKTHTGQVALTAPAADAINQSITNLSFSWGTAPGATGYRIQIGTASGLGDVVSVGASSPYTLSGPLSYSTDYYWSVFSVYPDGRIEYQSAERKFTTMADPTIDSFPYTQNFDGTWSGSPAAPLGWTVINANNDDYLWSQANTYISPTHSGSYAAHGMGNTNDYLITPHINLTGINGRMKWWDKVESATYPNSYKVLLSTTDTDPASFTEELGDYTCTNTAWTEHTINLDAYADQTVYIAFYQYASASPYYGFGIDDFLLEEIPAMPVFSYSPSVLAFPFTQSGLNSTALNVTVTNTGAGTLSFGASDVSITGTDAGDFSFDPANLPADLTTGQSVTIPVSFTPQSAGQKSATLVINYNSVDYEVTLSAYAYAATANFEGFENTTFPPAGWANPGSWSKSTYTVFEGSGSAYKSSYSTTPYILSTPKLDIVGGDELVFMARISTITAALDIVYSTDRATWTKLGDSILAPTANTWFPVIVDLGAIPAKTGAYYLGFRTMASASYYIDNVILPPFALEAPDAVTLSAPTNAATGVGILPTLSWTAAAAGGVPTSYDIYLEANDNISADPATLLANVPASPYTLTTALDYTTTYIWKVVAKNAVGDAPASAVRSFTTMDDPTQPFPYSQDFNSGTSLTTIGWSGAMSITNGHGSTSNVLYKNLYSSVTTTNAVTPPIGPMQANAELMFDYRYVDYSSPYPGTVLSAGDNLQIQVSTDNGATFTTIHTIDQSNHVTSGSFATVTLELDAYSTGSIMLKFLANWGAGDYYLDIDNVFVRVTPANPIFAISPTEKNYGVVNLNASSSQIFTITNVGAGTLTIDNEAVTLAGENASEFSLSPIAEDINLTAGQTAQITVTFTPVTEGLKEAQLQIVDNTPSEKMGMKSGPKATQIVDLSGEGYDPVVTTPYRGI